MSFFKKNKILVTHNATFHADDIFATATLSILNNGKIKIIRTRDEDLIKNADYVYDVGGVYDPSINRFDHHQKGGAGKRENGIPYAAFGLVWKTYGEAVCGSLEVAKKIDEDLVQAIDAQDNGVDLYKIEGAVGPYLIQSMFNAFRPSWKEKEDFDTPFLELVEFATKFLIRKIKKVKDALEAETFVKKAYEEANDKRLIVIDGSYPWSDVLMEYPEPLYVIWERMGVWRVGCVGKEKKSFENRKPFPEAWAGLRDEELAKASGVPDAVFCHNGRFLAVAKSKEGALALADKALLA
jgi:uncharacterized UPF0160 family protein